MSGGNTLRALNSKFWEWYGADIEKAEALMVLDHELLSLRADNVRLRGLIKKAEDAGDLNGWCACPWCTEDMEVSDKAHAAECPAFDVNGNVK